MMNYDIYDKYMKLMGGLKYLNFTHYDYNYEKISHVMLMFKD